MAEGPVTKARISDNVGSDDVDSVYRSTSTVYKESFFRSLQQLRHDCVFCDVKLEVDGETFACHKVILMAGSQYFHAMFVTDMSEHDKDAILIGGVSKQIFACLLEFLYSGVIEISEETCEELLMAADMLSVTEVVTACCTFLKNKLQPHNCIGIYRFAEAVACKMLRKAAEVYIFRNFLRVCQEEEFFSVSKELVTHFLYSECLHVENEYQVFKAAIGWVLHNSQDRRKHIFDMMMPIRFPILSESQMDKYIASLTDTDLSIKVALQKIVNDFRVDRKTPVSIDKRNKLLNIKPFHLVPRQCSRKNIYVCGGFTRPKGGRWSDAVALNTMERYDTFNKTWHECSSFQFHRSALGAGVVNGQVCVVGGENDMLILDSVETYDPVTYEWKSLSGMTSPRCGLGVCTLDNCLYAIGGWVGSEIGGTVEKYDPELYKWNVIAHCRSLKCWMGTVADNGLLYVVGGSNDLGDELTSVESFNPITKEWASLPDLNIKRSYTAVAYLDDCLYAVGGWNEADGALSSVEKLNFEKGFWVEVAPMAEARAGANVVVVNNMLYVIGGRNYTKDVIVGRIYTDAPSTLGSMEAYDVNTDTWTDMGNMITSRCEGAAVII